MENGIITDKNIIEYFYTNTGKFWKNKLKKCSESIINYLKHRYTDSLSLEETIYRIYNKINIHPKCPVCGDLVALTKKLQFKCTCDKEECIKQYRYNINPFNNKEIQNKIHSKTRTKEEQQKIIEKRKQTCIKKYGGTSPMCSYKVKQKSINTNLERYGVVNGGGSADAIKKIKKTKLERYGDETYRNEDKIKETNIERYGTEYVFSSDVIKNKIKDTCLERYGVVNGGGSDEAIEKIKQTKLERYGDETYRNENKIKETNIEKYGVEYSILSDVVRNKIKETNIERYGVEYPTSSNVVRDKIKETCLSKYDSSSYFGSITHINSMSDIQQKRFNTLRDNNTWNISNIENQICKYLDEHNIEYKYQYKSELYPYACDFYFPTNNLYVEIQGNWTHGKKPYENTNEDNNIISIWESKNSKYYDNAIKTWSIYDVKKRNTAKKNKLNYLEIFSIDFNECIKQIETRL